MTAARGDDDRGSPAAGARYDSDEVREAVDFLAWLLRGNFVLLGAREYEITRRRVPLSSPARASASCADEERSAYAQPVPLDELPRGVARRWPRAASC